MSDSLAKAYYLLFLCVVCLANELTGRGSLLTPTSDTSSEAAQVEVHQNLEDLAKDFRGFFRPTTNGNISKPSLLEAGIMFLEFHKLVKC